MTSIEGSNISRYRLSVQRKAVELEKKGMKRRGPSITSLLKKEFGMGRNASHDMVLLRLQQEIDKLDAALVVTDYSQEVH